MSGMDTFTTSEFELNNGFIRSKTIRINAVRYRYFAVIVNSLIYLKRDYEINHNPSIQ